MARDALLDTETKIIVLFMLLGLTSWYLAQQVTTSRVVSFAALIGVGVLAPTLINEWRRRQSAD
ncbi:hypothetical protein ACOZ4L_07205 [Haloplanus ruber]|uniref:Uncharacterized protein n=1 Tax=Haloplanus ruber TaxID=869892 RepID=A0ABD6CTI0_9EURY|nr:hypothetical protein [Haloplanus ruber]